MKKTVIAAMLLLAAIGASAKNDWKGKVIDEKGEPVAYANVAVLSRADSTVVCGAVTGEDGTFSISTKETDGIMMVAILGYRTVYLTPIDGQTITLIPDTAMLEGAAVQAVMPKTKLTGEGLQTSVRGSVLENAGSAADVLEKTPGLIKTADGLEVIGKGAPLVYINGRRVTDSGELRRLQSNEIQSIEVITNPGAQYDATVRSVVRIKTIRRQGDGFGFNLNASDAQSLRWNLGNDPSGALNVNYRTGGVDIFAGVNYDRNTSRQLSDAETASYGIAPDGSTYVFENKGDIEAQYFSGTIYGNAGVNWQIADNHFLGGKVEWGKQLSQSDISIVNSKVYENSMLVDDLHTESTDCIGPGPYYNLGANVYYNGTVGKLGIDVNFDYYGTSDSKASESTERSSMTHDAHISSEEATSGRMYAGKAVLSYPIWQGQLQVGTEETFSRRSDIYSITGVSIPASQAAVREDNYAGFASYGFYLPKVGQMSAGVRFEHVDYDYVDAVMPDSRIERSYNNWFPTVSYAGVIETGASPVQLMLNYSAKTRRPNYSLLSGAIRYNSRYIWQSGNNQLQPELSHNFSVGAVWNWLTVMVNYTRTDGAIMTWSSPYNDEGVVLVKPCNIETPFRNLSAYLVLTPTVGPWTMSYTFGALPQWLTINAPDPRVPGGTRAMTFNDKPCFFAQLQNTVVLPGDWQLELGAVVQTPGYTQNLYLRKTYFDLTAAVQKKLLKDGSLVLRLEGRDLAGLANYDVSSDFGSHTILQTNIMDTQKIKFSIRYSFNTAQSKYRGTGAGADSKNRM